MPAKQCGAGHRVLTSGHHGQPSIGFRGVHLVSTLIADNRDLGEAERQKRIVASLVYASTFIDVVSQLEDLVALPGIEPGFSD